MDKLPTQPVASQLLTGKILQGTYRLERLIGLGGMGAVYEASHLRLRRHFAIKILSSNVASNEEAIARFHREAEIVSALDHPNIVEVTDFNYTDDGAPYLVMELLSGHDLGDHIKREGRLAIPAAQSIVRQTCIGLAVAHEQNVIHRDLKPQNLFLVPRPHEPDLVKLVDFGISKIVGAQTSLTATHATMGTPSYMAPEQVDEAETVDHRTDIYAMGAILYEALCGRPPITGKSVLSALYKIVHEAPTPLRELRPGLPEAIYDVLDKALSKKREERFDSALAFADAFDDAVEQMAEAEAEGGLAYAPTRVTAGTLTEPGYSTGPEVNTAAQVTQPPIAAVVEPPASNPTLTADEENAIGTSTLSSSIGQLREATEFSPQPKRGRKIALIATGIICFAATAIVVITIKDSGEKEEPKAASGREAEPPTPTSTASPQAAVDSGAITKAAVDAATAESTADLSVDLNSAPNTVAKRLTKRRPRARRRHRRRATKALIPSKKPAAKPAVKKPPGKKRRGWIRQPSFD